MASPAYSSSPGPAGRGSTPCTSRLASAAEVCPRRGRRFACPAGRRGVQQGQDHKGAVGDGRRLLQASRVEDQVSAAFHQVITRSAATTSRPVVEAHACSGNRSSTSRSQVEAISRMGDFSRMKVVGLGDIEVLKHSGIRIDHAFIPLVYEFQTLCQQLCCFNGLSLRSSRPHRSGRSRNSLRGLVFLLILCINSVYVAEGCAASRMSNIRDVKRR